MHLFDGFRDEITSVTIVHRKSYNPSESVLYILALILLQHVNNPLKMPIAKCWQAIVGLSNSVNLEINKNHGIVKSP